MTRKLARQCGDLKKIQVYQKNIASLSLMSAVAYKKPLLEVENHSEYTSFCGFGSSTLERV